MFADAVERARNELAAASYEQGLDKARVQRWQEAASAYEESLKYKDTSTIAPNVRLASPTRTATSAARATRSRCSRSSRTPSQDREIQDDALHLLALCQQDIEAWNEAKNTWRTLVRRFPDSHFTPEGKLQLMSLNALH